MTGVFFAFGCLVLTALNDFVFKLFAGGRRSKGMFVATIGVVWMFSLLMLPHSSNANWVTTMVWGVISGIFSAGGNILLIEGMSRQSVGLCSLIYRLNMVPVVIGASLFLNESTGTLQIAGIACAILAVILFQLGGGMKAEPFTIGIALVIGASLMRAGMGLSYKYAFLHGADKNAVAQINSLFWIAGGIAYALIRERGAMKPDKRLLGYGALSGVLVAGIVLLMAWSLFYGNAAVVLPIAQMSFAVTFLLGVIFLKERFCAKHIAALICGALAVILLAVQ